MPLVRLRMWWEGAFWVIPVLGVLAGWLLDYASVYVDEWIFGISDVRGVISPSASVTLLAAIGGSMVTFMGFVFSVILLMLQYGSSEYSPRAASYFMRTRTTQRVLAVFLATILFSFLSILEVGSQGREDFAPVGSVVMAVMLLLLSLLSFLALLNVVGRRIRVDAVLADIGRRARENLAARFAHAEAPHSTTLERIPAAVKEAELVRFSGRPGQVVAVHSRRLTRIARRSRSRIILMIRTGDAVSEGSHLALISGGKPVTSRQLSRCLLVEDERSLRLDPLYALRILSDISLRALSPGINDPTTAVRSLDEVEGVLRAAAPLTLGPVEITAGAGSLVLRSPTWTDIVDLALLEVVSEGVGQPQVTRRLTALLNDLLADLPENRHRPLLRFKRRLTEQVDASVGSDEYRSIYLTGDRQGIGGSR
jgi:uncharacterized membrane protein